MKSIKQVRDSGVPESYQSWMQPSSRWAISCKHEIAPLLWRTFTSIQMFHTHTPLGGDKTKVPTVRWWWGWQRNENEMRMKMRWKFLNRNTRRGTHKKKRRNQEKTPTPTHLARCGRTLKRQGKRKSGGRRKQTQTGGGGGRQKRLNQPKPQRKQDLPKHARTRTYLERGSTHEIGDPWGPSWWKTKPKPIGIQFLTAEVVRYSLSGT